MLVLIVLISVRLMCWKCVFVREFNFYALVCLLVSLSVCLDVCMCVCVKNLD